MLSFPKSHLRILSSLNLASKTFQIGPTIPTSYNLRHSSIQIPVILTHTIPKIGDKGEEIKILKGFARNYLYPQALAVPATDKSRKEFEKDRANIDYVARQKVNENRKFIKRLAKIENILIKRHINPEGRLHSPITREVLAEKLKKQHRIEVKPELILSPDMKIPGIYEIKINVSGLEVPIQVKFVKR